MKDRNNRTHRLVPVTGPAEQTAVLGEATLQSPIGGADGSGVWAERGSLEQYRKWVAEKDPGPLSCGKCGALNPDDCEYPISCPMDKEPSDIPGIRNDLHDEQDSWGTGTDTDYGGDGLGIHRDNL